MRKFYDALKPGSRVKLRNDGREETERSRDLKLKGGVRGNDETNYLIKAIRCKVSKPGFPSLPCRGNPLSANWGVPRLMSEERRAKRRETKRRRVDGIWAKGWN